MAYPDFFAHQCADEVLISICTSPEIKSILSINAKVARILAAEITAVCDQIEQKQAEAA